MELDWALEAGRHAMWMTLVTSGPILLVGLVVGLALAFLQAVTQLQEQSLTFVPKIVAMVGAAVVFIPWITEQMVAYTKEMLGGLPW